MAVMQNEILYFTPEQVAEMLSALDRLGGSHGAERRRHARSALRVPVEIIRQTGTTFDAVETVLLLDYSAQGIGFQHIQHMDPNQRLLLRLTLPGGRLGYLPCSVATSVAQDDGSYRIGARIDLSRSSELPVLDVATLLASRV